MEVEDINRNPESNFKYLVQQVEEQSVLCDMTVKRGLWEKKFHRCVLAACPFFENIIRGNFIEKQTGIVEIKVNTTPSAIEMALMFLYGKKPAFSIKNVGGLLELAEFFMIEGLKSACIEWLRSEEITKENCMHVMQLFTKFNFDANNCIDYIESHLSEIFKTDGAMNLSKESIEYIFCDSRFSYVSMDEKLLFLVKWVDMHSCEKAENVSSLFKTIDMNEVSYSVFEKAKRSVQFSKKVDLENVVIIADNENSKHSVLIMYCSIGYFWCIDLQDDRWYRLNSNIKEFEHLHDIGGVRNSLPEIYFKCKRFVGRLLPKLLTVNLESDQTTIYQLVLADDDITKTKLSSISLTEDTVIATVNKTLQVIEVLGIRQSDGENERRPNNQAESSLDEITGDPDHISVLLTRRTHEPYSFDIEELLSSIPGNSSKDLSVRDVDYSEVYYGHISEETVELSALFALRNEEIIDTCLSRQSTAALLVKSMQYVIIFDLVDLKMEKIELEPDSNYKMAQTEEEFLIYNNTHCYSLKRLSGPSLSKKYLIDKIVHEKVKGYVFRYRYCNGIWIRLVHYGFMHSNTRLQYVSHKEILDSKISGDLKWKQLPLPHDKKINDKLMNDNFQMFMVPLSKRRLRCHYACPHCTLTDPPKNKVVNPFQNGFIVDSSDDEYDVQYSSESDSE